MTPDQDGRVLMNYGRLTRLNLAVMEALEAWVDARGIAQEERLAEAYAAYRAECDRQARGVTFDT